MKAFKGRYSSRQQALRALLCLGALVCAIALAARPSQGTEDGRPPAWARPIEGKPGLDNFFWITDGLYRGAQPKEQGFEALRKLGVKTVVNLRTFHSDRSECRKAGLKYVHIRVQAWELEEEEVVKFLKAVIDPQNQPVFVHCQHGADRTGAMSAIYRVAVQGWSREEAIKEMTEGGFHFHSIWKDLVAYVRDCDIERLQRLAGIKPGHGSAGSYLQSIPPNEGVVFGLARDVTARKQAEVASG